MRFLILPFIVCILSSASYCQTKKSIVRKAVIEFEAFTTTTNESVRCDSFRSTFRETRKEILFTKEELNKLSLWQSKFVAIKPRLIDVRVLLRLYINGNVDEYCMDRFGVFIQCKSGKYFENKLLSELIRYKCLPSNLR
jgi:hypothetical protein